MKTIRYNATINGVETAMIFTPRLFEFKTAAMEFTAANPSKVATMYADLAYCAALNYWTLDDKDANSFPLKRIDFHEWAAMNPSEFGKMMRIAVEAITNKSLDELIHNDSQEEKQEEVKKKSSSSIIQRLKRFWSVFVE